MPGIEIRAATTADHATFLRLFAELGIDDPPYEFERFAREIMPTMLLAERKGEAVGYAYYRLMTGTAHLGQIVSAPEARRSGVGRALFEETIRRVKPHASELFLNVRPANVAAMTLYESFGLRPIKRSFSLAMKWAAIEALPAPFLADVRPLDASDDRRLEEKHLLANGLLASLRAFSNRLPRSIGAESFAVFDPTFPGVYPLIAESPEHAFSLLRAFRSSARPEHDGLNISLEDQPAIADALVAAGARLRFEMRRMRGFL